MFLNRYSFAYAGRDVVNQAAKVTPKLISQATGEINKIAQQRIDQVVCSGGAEIERVATKVIRGAIEEVYKIPFRLLGNLGKKQFQKIKRKLFKEEEIMLWKKKKSYNLLKSDKKTSAAGSKYTKKTETKISPSSSSSLAKSLTGLILKLPKQANTKKLHKIL